MSCKPIVRLVPAAIALAVSGPLLAVQSCELNGEHINLNNGNPTQGKTGLVRCRDADSGAVLREQELQNGKQVGVMRYFKNGQVEREYRVNEVGNRDGLSREWNVAEGGAKRVLVREETLRNGKTIGLARTWYESGQRRRLTFYGDDEREAASAEFTAEGKLYDLRCGPAPVFGPEFDDKSACGFAGPATVVLYGGKGQPVQRIAYERGERRKTETLWESGAVRELRETTAAGGFERSFAADGTRRREQQWVAMAAAGANERPRRVTTLDQEFHESGRQVRERRWRPAERGAELVLEATWYLNGQPKTRTDYADAPAGTGRLRRETNFHDNGKAAFEGSWLLPASGSRDRADKALGTHKSFDDQGRLRSEQVYDERGRIAREREFDERGTLVRDDEVFEDGSRKSAGR